MIYYDKIISARQPNKTITDIKAKLVILVDVSLEQYQFYVNLFNSQVLVDWLAIKHQFINYMFYI